MAPIGRFFRDPGVSYFLFGPRGTGKSTWLRQSYPAACYIDLLKPEEQRRYQAHPEHLRSVVSGDPDQQLFVIDEVQKAPAVLDVVHELIEARKDIRFILTGSSSRKLKRTGVDLLAGRAVLQSMHPFMAAELGDRFVLEKALQHGMLPLVWDSPNPQLVLMTYASLYLREEVQMEGLVRNVGSFARFLETVALTHANVLNISDVAREAQVSRKSAEAFVEILEDLLLAFRIPVFTKRAKRHLASHPKLYLFDSGVYNSLRPAGPLDRREEVAGAGLEGLLAQHLRAWIGYSSTPYSLSYWRTKSGTEVDFVVYGVDGFWAFEVTHARTVRGKDLRGLKTFREDYPNAQTRFLYRGDEALEIDGVRCLPIESYLRAIVPGEPLP